MRAVFLAWLWLALSLFAVGCGSGGDAPPERMPPPAGGQQDEEPSQPDRYQLKLDRYLGIFYEADDPNADPLIARYRSRAYLEQLAQRISLRLNVDPPEVDVFAVAEAGAGFPDQVAGLGLLARPLSRIEPEPGAEYYFVFVPLPLMREFARLPGLIRAESSALQHPN